MHALRRLALATLLTLPMAAAAQGTYPTKPIRLVVPLAAGIFLRLPIRYLKVYEIS
jgi:tripartite-type tricarboxylate transporter receptor subunit TctC